jgi:lysophospholipase L1-like esterase
MKEKFKYLLMVVVVYLLCTFSVNAQSDSLMTDSMLHDENVIDNIDALQNFYKKLNVQIDNPKQINILHLGDSHIEMGYFVEEARQCFKTNFDLAGFGSLFPYQLAKSIPYFVQTKTIKGVWEGKCYLKSENDFKYGLAGFTIRTKSKVAEFEMQALKCDTSIMSGNKVIVYYSANDSSIISLQGINYSSDSVKRIDPASFEIEVLQNDRAQCKKATFYFKQSIDKLIFSVIQQFDSIPFYISGIQLSKNNNPGIIYHNCGVVGATFKQLSKNSSMSVLQMLDVNPDLIIFSYGSNEAYEPNFSNDEYYRAITDYIQQVKIQLPGASIIITTPPDTRSNGRFPINNTEICSVLERVSKEQTIALWNLHNQMGGEGSMINWFNKGLASKDKLHFKKTGYELQAKMFMYALLKGYNEYYKDGEQLILPVYSESFKN